MSWSPRQLNADASFHSASFAESDHPRVLITGMYLQSFDNLIGCLCKMSPCKLGMILHDDQHNFVGK